MKVGLEKLESHEGVAVKVLLDSGATGLFMNTAFAKEKGFKIERLKNPLLVRNIDGTVNVRYHKRSLTCFCDGLNRFKELISRVRQATKDVVKSEV